MNKETHDQNIYVYIYMSRRQRTTKETVTDITDYCR